MFNFGRRFFTLLVFSFFLFSRKRVIIFDVEHPGDADEAVAFAEVDEADTLGCAADDTDIFHRGTDSLPGLGEHHDFVLFLNVQCSGDGFGLHGDDASAATFLEAVFFEVGAFALAVGPGDQEGTFRIHHLHGLDLVLAFETDADDATGGAALGTEVVFVEADGLARLGNDDEVVVTPGTADSEELVVLVDVDADGAGAAEVAVVVEGGLFDDAFLGAEDNACTIFLEAFDTDHGGDFFAFLDFEDIVEGAAFGDAAAFWDFVDLLDVHPAVVHEEHDEVVRRGTEDVLDEVIFVLACPPDADTAAFLGGKFVNGGAFDKSVVGDGDEAGLLGDEVLHAEVAGGFGKAGAAGCAVFVLDGPEFRLDDAEQLAFVLQDFAEAGDAFLEFVIFFLDLIALHAGKLVEAEVEDGVGLAVGEGVLLHEADPGFLTVLGGADDTDDVVHVVQRDEVAFEDVRTVEGFVELELGTAKDDFAAVLDVALDQLLDVHLLGPAFVEGKQDDAEGGFELGHLIELVDDDAGDLTPTQLNDDAGVFVGLVTEVGDAFDELLVDESGDLGDEGGSVDVVRDLRDDDLLLVIRELLHFTSPADAEDATAGFHVPLDLRPAGDGTSCGEVGTREDLDDLVESDVWVVDDGASGVDDFRKVVRGDVRGHPDGDPSGAVDEKVGDGGRENGGLGCAFLVIGYEVDSVLVDVLDHFLGDGEKAAFGVPVGGGRVAIDGAEVALAFDQGIPHDPGLGEADEGVVDRCVTVGVVILQNFPDDPGAFIKRTAVEETFPDHGVEDPALDWFETVPGIGEGPGNDDRHRVVDVGGLHDLGNVGRDKAFQDLGSFVVLFFGTFIVPFWLIIVLAPPIWTDRRLLVGRWLGWRGTAGRGFFGFPFGGFRVFWGIRVFVVCHGGWKGWKYVCWIRKGTEAGMPVSPP